MTFTGLEQIVRNFPKELREKRIGLLCHAASIISDYTHAIDCLQSLPCHLTALFGPQHGLFGQTQDNMVEWEGFLHPRLKIPVYSLYGEHRKPAQSMLSNIDIMLVDLQDVGARPYTYIWTIKLCMEACLEKGIPLWVLDRPNPIGKVPFDGPILSEDYYSFVGGAPIPLSHRMTIGEIATLLKKLYFQSLDLQVVWMEDWKRFSMFFETHLPWVLPSPNMPTLDTAIVYPGMVLLEATNLSEGRGTTRPFELIGAPFLKAHEVLEVLRSYALPGCLFREHGFIPTFQKWQGKYCQGIQVHVTNPGVYLPVFTTIAIISAIIETSGGLFQFKNPPYEYENGKMPFDILAGNAALRKFLEGKGAHKSDLVSLQNEWISSLDAFMPLFNEIAHYPEK
jgi:uncharacterized protein YbbC (DUF1343 family)